MHANTPPWLELAHAVAYVFGAACGREEFVLVLERASLRVALSPTGPPAPAA